MEGVNERRFQCISCWGCSICNLGQVGSGVGDGGVLFLILVDG